jgi:putative flippase GtrA
MRSRLARYRQFMVFVAGGGASALLDVGLMQLLIMRGVAYQAAATAGFAASLLLNYAFHARVTFGASATPFSFARFMCVVGINYLVTMACVSLSVVLASTALAGKLVSLPLVAVNGFLLGKYWIYK